MCQQTCSVLPVRGVGREVRGVERGFVNSCPFRWLRSPHVAFFRILRSAAFSCVLCVLRERCVFCFLRSPPIRQVCVLRAFSAFSEREHKKTRVLKHLRRGLKLGFQAGSCTDRKNSASMCFTPERKARDLRFGSKFRPVSRFLYWSQALSKHVLHLVGAGREGWKIGCG